MKRSRTRALSFLLTIAMVLSLLVLPAAAGEGDLTGAVGNEWVFKGGSDFTEAGYAYGNNSSGLNFKGLTISAGAGYHQGYCYMNTGHSLKFPVAAKCNVEVVTYTGPNATISGAGGTQKTLSGTKTVYTCEEAGEVTIANTSGMTLIEKISIVAVSETPEVGDTTIAAGKYQLSKFGHDGERATTFKAVADIPGLETTLSPDNSGHGPCGKGTLTVHLPSDKYSTLLLTTCTFGKGSPVTVSINGGEAVALADKAGPAGDENGDGGNVYKIPNATGDTVITFGGTVYVHGLTVGEFTDTPDLTSTLTLDKTDIVVKVGESVTITPTIENVETPVVTAIPAETAAAAAVGDNNVITITGSSVGKTTVTVAVTGTELTETVKVRVIPAEIGTVSENTTYQFQGVSADTRVDTYYSQGLEWMTAMGLDNGEGPYAKSPTLNVYIPDGKQTTLTIEICGYVGGSQATLTADGKEVAGVDNETAEGGNTGKTFTVEGATGKTVLSFASAKGALYFHKISVGAFTDADPDAGDKFEAKSWDLDVAAADGITGTVTDMDYQGLTFNGKFRRQSGHGVQFYTDGAIEIPVPGDCDIKVSTNYKLDVYLEGQEPFNETVGNPVTLYYRGEAGTVKLHSGSDGNCYVTKIELVAPSETVPPALRMDKGQDVVMLKMGETETAQVNVNTRSLAQDAVITATSGNAEAVRAEYNKTTGKVDVTALAATESPVTVTVAVTGTELQDTFQVSVEAAGEVVYYIAEGTYDFAGMSTPAQLALVKGLDAHGNIPQAATPGHGIQEPGSGAGTSGTATGKIELTVNIPEGKTADLIFVTCRFGIGTALLMESTSGTVTKAEAEVDSATGLQYTVAGASGETTLTFHIPEGKDPEGNEWNKGIWIHSMSVLFGAQKEEDRKIDVWDLTGQEETGESYRNNITAQGWKDSGAAVNGVLSGGTEFTVGDFTLIHNTNDRLYSGVEGAADYGAGATAGYGKWTFEGDSYEPNGGVYCNGKGSATTRYMQVKNVFPGDKLVVYGGSAQTGAVTFNFEGLGGAASQPIESFTVPDAGTGKKMEFVAQATGTYKIWCSDPGKPMYQRVVRVPGVPVTGAITLPQDYTGPAEYGIKFVNTTTKAVTVAEVKNDQYTVTLAPGYEYNAIMTGARGWGFTVNTKKATTAEDGGVGVDAGMTHDMTVEPKQTYTFSGSFVGFADGYDISKLTVDLIPEEGSGSDDTALEITGKTFTAILDPEVEYTLVLGGVNDYVIKTPLTMKSDKDDVIQDITVEPKATYAVSGKFTGLGEDGTVTALNFENVDDKYTYAATVTADGYSVNLRPGSYAAKATVEGKYATKTHVVVVDKAVEKDLMFVSTAAKPAVDKVKDVYVGYAAKSPNFDTVSAAMDAVSRMGIAAEADRVTVHIAPGTYREQIMVTTPYVTFINDEPAKGEVLLTWYYGIGYKYYSAGSPAEGGYYNAERAYDKFEKNIADRWGTAVRVTGKAFRAENITFENSFNRYITEEEIVDGVELAGTGGSATIRQYGVDVTSKAATERAAAICVEADESEFYNCKFYSSQDTVYTQGKVYFKNCLIEGQTDYIFGDLASKCIFDACQLSWKGYGADSQGGYITALRSNKGEGGYLFRNCAVTANSKLTVTPGYFGRPWGADAAVFFLNTKLEKANLITDVGWYDMSGNKPENAQFAEFGTTVMGGTAVDTSKRAGNTVKTQADADALKMSDYFGTWVPYYYTAEAETVAFTTDPTITDNGDINTPYPGHTLTVHYSLGAANDANDASLIQWSRVSADGTETVVKTTTAAVGKTYQIAKADQGATIKVTVTPTTVSGKTGAAKSITMDNPVREGYEDPTGKTDPELGDGVNIFLAGDSTVFDYNGRDEGSWGEFLQNYFNKDYVTVVDHAVGGRSCRSFINEGRLDTIAANIKEGDFLLIQFGHNDCANEDAYRAERYAPLGDPDANGNYPSTAGTKDADGKYTWNCGGTYKWYLQQYIDVAQKAGATPILVTPVARLYYESDGTIRPHHDASLVPGTEETTKTTNPNKSDTYVAAVKQLAQENKIACIDGFGITKALYEDAYKAAGNNTYGQQVMHSGDSTHSNKLGGMIQAAEIASALQNMGLTISKTVKAPAMAMAQTVKGQTVFSVNGAGKLTAYDMLTKPEPYAETAPYWMGVGQKLFDDIAAKAKELNGGSTTDPSQPPVDPSQPPVDPSDPPKPADKAALTEAIAAAEKKAADTYTVSDDTKAGDVSRGTKFVTERDKAALTAAIAAAKSVADKADATAQEIAKAVADLKAAVETFDKAVKTGTKGSGGGSTSRPSGSATNAGTTSTVKNPDGSVATIKKAANGDKTITVKDKNGEVVAEVTLPATISTGKTKFVDVPGEHWAAKSINNMAALGMVKGVTEDTFDMTSPMTRGAIATILFRLSNGKEGKSVTFADVAKDAWYADAVGWAAGAKLITGYDETTFGPEDTITRQQLAVMIARYARLLGLDTTADTGALNAFTDGSSTDTWATDAMAWCVKAGVMNGRGNGTVDPKTNVTRAEAAAMLDRMIGLLK